MIKKVKSRFIDMTNIKQCKSIVERLYDNSFEDLDQRNKFLKKYSLLKQNREEIRENK